MKMMMIVKNDEFESNIEDQYDIGLQFREEIIPYAIEYYLGIVENEDNIEEEEEEEEEEEKEIEEKPKKKKGRKH